MTDRIEPELDAEQWAQVRDEGHADDVERSAWSGDWARVIAVGNDALPDDDQRKITRECIEEIRYGAMFARQMAQRFRELHDEQVAANREAIAAALDARADALESYLPPEP